MFQVSMMCVEMTGRVENPKSWLQVHNGDFSIIDDIHSPVDG